MDKNADFPHCNINELGILSVPVIQLAQPPHSLTPQDMKIRALSFCGCTHAYIRVNIHCC